MSHVVVANRDQDSDLDQQAIHPREKEIHHVLKVPEIAL
jgi:hypothetical protein